MPKITISEALNWQKTLAHRHDELINLRNQNSASELRYLGANADKTITRTPLYDPKLLDKQITLIAREMRLLNDAIKRTNATVEVLGYEQNDAVLGELS